MNDPSERRSGMPRAERERIARARAEVGRTAVTPRVARVLVGVFALALALPHAVQLGLDARFYRELGRGAAAARGAAPTSAMERVLAVNRGLLARARELEDRLADESVVGRYVRPVVQRAMTAWLGAGTAQVEVGTGGWLYYRPDLDHVTGRGFLSPRHLARRASAGDTLTPAVHADPRPALLALGEALRRRGVRLVVMPTPVKPSVEAGGLGASRLRVPVVTNPSYPRLVAELEAGGVAVFDVAGTLAALRREGEGPLYLATDTHWRPETVRRVAADLAAFVEGEAALSEPTGGYRIRAVEVTNRGDTARLLGLGAGARRFRAETVRAERVETDEGQAWTPARRAEVVLLGDSFTNVYSLAALGWGTSAGLAEHLSHALGRPVGRLSQNDDGAFAPRRLLAAELARDPDWLAATRVVVYQFASRELSQGDWRPIDWDALDVPGVPDAPDAPAAPAAGGAVWSAEEGVRATVEATVRAVGPVPRPGSVPYRDHIVAVLVGGVEVLDGPPAARGREAVVYLRSMADNELTAAAGLGPGDRVRLALEPWSNVAGELDGISRGELDDPRLLAALPWWGTPTAGGSP
ncbi:MAG: hypothetical protein OXH04_06880 [Acidobacteria bacterium]|nr:hypothetical protein [Acidobacteriota bacterium]